MALSSTIPTYRQLNPSGFFCPAAYLIEEGEAFEFEGEPNMEMEPLNEPARKKLEAFYGKLDAGRVALAEKTGHSFAEPQMNLTIGEASAEARRVSLTPNDGGIPIMGGTKNKVHVKKVPLQTEERIIRNSYAGATA